MYSKDPPNPMSQNTFRTLLLATALTFGSLGFAQAQDPAAAPDPKLVVAKVNGQDVTRADILNMADGMRPEIRANIDQVFPQLIDYYVFLKLVADKGRADGLAEDPAVKDLMRQAEDNAIREVFFQRAITAAVTDAAVKARYDEEAKTFPEQREVRASHILVKTEEEAKAIIEQLKGGADFATLAKEKSTDTASGKQGGDLSWFTKDMMVKEFADAAFELKKGETSQTPVKSQFGYHIIRLDDDRMKAPPSLESRQEEIRLQLTEELQQKVAKDLKDAATIEVIEPNGGVKPKQ